MNMRESYYDLHQALASIEADEYAYSTVAEYLKMARFTAGPQGARLVFIGNGGSAAIASHMAADYMKNGLYPTLCFNDAALLTCVSNDLGYENSFLVPLKHHLRFGDVVFVISSSGKSKNMRVAAEYARDHHCNVVTLTGFKPDNPLRSVGAVNFYVPSENYGTVEIAHLAILHSILDETAKW